MKGRRNFVDEIRASNGTAGETTELDTKVACEMIIEIHYRGSNRVLFFFFLFLIERDLKKGNKGLASLKLLAIKSWEISRNRVVSRPFPF